MFLNNSKHGCYKQNITVSDSVMFDLSAANEYRVSRFTAQDEIKIFNFPRRGCWPKISLLTACVSRISSIRIWSGRLRGHQRLPARMDSNSGRNFQIVEILIARAMILVNFYIPSFCLDLGSLFGHCQDKLLKNIFITFCNK